MEVEEQRGINTHHNKWSRSLPFYLLSVAAHTFVNKYILSVLKFQYPTVFISWQCGSCVVLLMTAYVLGFFELSDVDSIDSSIVRVWLPCLVLHTGVMYSGSVSLSKLEIPIFLGFQNLTYWFTEIVAYWKSSKLPTVKVQLCLLIVGLGAGLLLYSNYSRDPSTYKWTFAYVACSGFYSVFSEMRKDVKLSHLDKAYCNSLFSVVSLTLFSILSGEWRKTMDFPFLYYIRFHIGCICSGILCCLTVVFLSTLTKETLPEMTEVGTTLSKVLLSLFSLGIFDATLDVSTALCVLVLLIGGLLYTYFKLTELAVETEGLKTVRSN